MIDSGQAKGALQHAIRRENDLFRRRRLVPDDAQSGPDHVDGHRTAFMVISPYNKRKYVDSTFYAQPSMIRSIEMILGLDPMSRFDALADPITTCFTDTLDLTSYRAVPSNILASGTRRDDHEPGSTTRSASAERRHHDPNFDGCYGDLVNLR